MAAAIDFTMLLQAGCKVKTVSIKHIADLQIEIERRRENREFDVQFAKEYLYRFKFEAPTEIQANSIITIAIPIPPNKAIINWAGKQRTFILPPTYTAYDKKRFHIECLVAEAVGKQGYKIATHNLPLKLLATRSGLSKFGRNNIAYVEGMGSFMRLTAVYSDMPAEHDDWVEPQMMAQCQDCHLCQNACPTGAIADDHFLLHAEKCLTYHNEKASNIPFPEWIKPEWHNCLIGCIKCQAACPQNKPYLQLIGKTVEFSEEETKLLLKGTPREQSPDGTLEKMLQLGFADYFSLMPRNLSALLNKQVV